MSKRGISALIAVVLILGFSVAVGGVVLTWGGGFIKNLQESTERSAEKQMTCTSDVRLDIRKINFLGDKIELLIENVGKIDIEKFHVRVYGTEGVDSIEVNSGLPSFGISNYEVEFDPGKTGFVESVGVFPSIVYGNEVISCSNVKAREDDFEYSIPTGAVLYIPFDDGSAKDISGNGNDGTIYGADCSVNGRYGLGCCFDGDDDYVEMSEISIYQKDYTVGAWIKTPTPNKTNNIILAGHYWRAAFFLNDSSLYLYHGNGTGSLSLNASYNFLSDAWYYVVGTFNTVDGMVLYVDGNKIANDSSKNTAGYLHAKYYFIGMSSADVQPKKKGYFNGTIDQVSIWNRSLSEKEIKSLYYQR